MISMYSTDNYKVFAMTVTTALGKADIHSPV